MSQRTLTEPPFYRVYFSNDGHACLDPANPSAVRIGQSKSYFVDDQVIQRAFGSDLPDELSDLISVAMAIYLADRICPRDPAKNDRHDLHWTRRFELRLGLRCPDRWNALEVAGLLSELLWFLTEDQWTLRFFACPGQTSPEAKQGHLFPTPPSPPVRVSLFSGGLDSFAGLCSEIRDNPLASLVAVGGHTNKRLLSVQRDLLRNLCDRSGARLIPMLVPFGLERDGTPYEDEERTQRSRGFVYMALGAVTAMMAGTNELFLHEGGVGAINLPYTEGQLGAQNTRAAHPSTASMMGNLIELVTNRPFSVRLPLLFSTKAQSCRAIVDLGLSDLVPFTKSCDGFPQRFPHGDQCGRCTSCLLRRASLLAAGLRTEDARSRYVTDVYDAETTLRPAQAYYARAMSDQVRRLERAIHSTNPWRSLLHAFPSLVEVAEQVASAEQPLSTVQERLVSLYRDYCREWRQFEAAWSAPPLVRNENL